MVQYLNIYKFIRNILVILTEMKKKMLFTYNSFGFILILIFCSAPVIFAQNNFVDNFELSNGIKYYNSHNYKKAALKFNQYIAMDSTREGPYVYLAASYLELGKTANAEKVIKTGLLNFPNSQSLLWLFAENLLSKREFDKSLKYYERIKNNFSRDSKKNYIFSDKQLNIRLGELYQIKTSKYFSGKNYKAALTYAVKTKKFFPDSLNSFTNLAAVYLKLKKYNQALKLSNQGLKLFPGSIQLIKIKSSAEYGLHNYKSMLEQYKILYKKNPDDVDNAIIYGELLNMNREYLRANKFFLKLLKKHPYNKKIYKVLIAMNENKGSEKGELNVLRLEQKHFPKDTSVYNKIASTYEAIKKWKNARMVYDTLITISKDSLKYGIAIAGTFEQQDSLHRSESLLTDLLKKYPSNIQLLNYIGKLQKDQQEWEKASETYHELNKFNPGTNTFINLGYVNGKLRNIKKEYNYYLKAIKNGTNQPVPYWGLSKIFLAKNINDSAFVFSKSALLKSMKKLYNDEDESLKKLNSTNDVSKLPKVKIKKTDINNENELTKNIFKYFTENFQNKKVMPVLDTLIILYAGSGRLLAMEGEYYLSQGDSVRAIQFYRKALGLMPKLRDAQMKLADIYFKRKQYQSAIQFYSRALSLNSKKDDAYHGLIAAYEAENRMDKLCELWSFKYETNKGNLKLKEFLIEALDKAGKYKQAKRIIAGE